MDVERRKYEEYGSGEIRSLSPSPSPSHLSIIARCTSISRLRTHKMEGGKGRREEHMKIEGVWGGWCTFPFIMVVKGFGVKSTHTAGSAYPGEMGERKKGRQVCGWARQGAPQRGIG